MKKLIRTCVFGFTLMELYLIGKKYKSSKSIFSKFIVRWCKHKINTQYSCYISFDAEISNDCRFVHPVGIVIGKGAVIKQNCQIYQGVTIGAARQDDESEKKYPIIEKGTIIFAGAKVIGGINIGKNSIVGANSVVNRDVKEDHIVAGIPAKHIRQNNEINR